MLALLVLSEMFLSMVWNTDQIKNSNKNLVYILLISLMYGFSDDWCVDFNL